MSSGTQGHQYSNHGSGSQYVASGNQNINTGSGSQYNADIINFNSAQDSDASLLNDLYVTDPTADKIRIERTKGGILRDSYSWILGHTNFRRWRTDAGSRLLWVKGDPGKGKTMLLCGIIDELEKWEAEPVYFFCQATDGRINTANAVLRGLLYMLLRRRPSLITHVRDGHQHAGKQLFEDPNGWDSMCKILESMLAGTEHQLDNIIFLIDGLDECTKGLDELLKFIVKLSFNRNKIIVSSRNWPSIEEAMEAAEQKVPIWLELNDEAISTAVLSYINYKVDELAQKKKYDAVLRDEVQEYLASNSNNTFLWVSLVSQQLDKVAKRHARANLSTMPRDLNEFYDRMLTQMLNSDDAVACKDILAVVLVAYRPVNLAELGSLTESPEDFINDKDSLRNIVGQCGSLLTLGPKDDVVYIVHQSAKDFLTKHTVGTVMPNGISYQHRLVLSRSLDALSKTLRRNIYGLESPSTLKKDIKAVPDPDPLEGVRYSCANWTKHAQEGDLTATEYKQVYSFLKKHYLHWLEAMSLLESMTECIACMLQLLAAVQSSAAAPHRLQHLVNDALRFIRYHYKGISTAPLQTYAAIAFTPTRSIIRRQFREEPHFLLQKPAMDNEWHACLQTLEARRRDGMPVAFSSSGAILASACERGAGVCVRLWDVLTGQCLDTIAKQTGWSIISMAFHPCFDDVIVIALDPTNVSDGPSKLQTWDLREHQCTEAFVGGDDESCVGRLRFSLDGRTMAFCTLHYVEFVDWQTRTIVQKLQIGEQMQNTSGSHLGDMAFSNDGGRFSFCSENGRIVTWDLKTGVRLWSVWSGSNARSVVFSQDGVEVMSAHEDCTVKVWDATTGSQLETINIGEAEDEMYLVEFSADLKTLASDYGNQVKLWDLTTGRLIRIFDGHGDQIDALKFSPDNTTLASVSRVIKIWDLETVPSLATPGRHGRPIRSMAYSAEGDHLVSVSEDGIELWDARTGRHLQTMWDLGDFAHGVMSVAFSGDVVWLANCLDGKCVTLWDATNRVRLQSLTKKESDFMITALAFSSDSALLAVAFQDSSSVKLWDIEACQWRGRLSLESTPPFLSLAGTGLLFHFLLLQGDPENNSGDSLTAIMTASSKSQRIPGFGIRMGDPWVRKDGKKTLWLPLDYRTHVFATKGSSIALGCTKGQVLFFQFA